MVHIQLAHRTVHPTAPLSASPADPTAVPYGAPPSAAADATSTASQVPVRDAPIAQQVDWCPRFNASYLARGTNGTWYLRLVVPSELRAAHPNLPKELRRSTETPQRRLAQARARKMCIDFFSSYSSRKPQLLAPDEKAKQSFAVVYVDGGFRTECGRNATPATILLMNRCVERLQAQIVARASRPSATKLDDRSSVTNAELDAEHRFHNPNADDISTDSIEREDTSVLPSVLWLSDAIDEWRQSGGVRFSEQSWVDSYKPTFRVFRELVGDVRRSTLTDGTLVPGGLLDIDVRQIGRTHIELLHKRMKHLPARQGQRDDGIEALDRIATAANNKSRLPSAHSVAKKMGQLRPFLIYALNKGWINDDTVKEMTLAVRSADAKVILERKSSSRKPGYVALALDELKRMFEQPAFLHGALDADWKFWIPIICLHNGLRVSEVSQLYTEDVYQVDGVWCASVVHDCTPELAEEQANECGTRRAKAEFRSSEEHRRRTKNVASRRVVPVHPRLIELGFLDYVAHVCGRRPGSQHLFAELRWESKSMFGRQPSEHMRKLLASAGIAEKRRKVPHSLRSNFKQRLEKTFLPDNFQKRLLGHSTDSEKDTSYNETDFGPAFPAAEVLPFLARCDFELQLFTWGEITAKRSDV